MYMYLGSGNLASDYSHTVGCLQHTHLHRQETLSPVELQLYTEVYCLTTEAPIRSHMAAVFANSSHLRVLQG
jgi:hypothetical protein